MTDEDEIPDLITVRYEYAGYKTSFMFYPTKEADKQKEKDEVKHD